MSPDNVRRSLHFESQEENQHFQGVRDVSPTELWERKQEFGEELRVIDVRQPEEFVGELGHVPKSELMVLNYLPELMAEETDKQEHIVFVCRSGGRSAQATAYAQSIGFSSVYNLKGGLLLWNELNLPTESDIGE